MKEQVLAQLEEILKGNQLLCAQGEAGNFKDMTTLLMLVARSEADLLVVPYYDVKKLNLWQDLFVWLFDRKLDDNEQQNYLRLQHFYTNTSKLRAQGWPLYLHRYKGQLLERSPFNNLNELRKSGSSYAALVQQTEYNELTVVPRFNVVEAVANIYEKYKVWVDPYWLEEQSKDWGQKGTQFVLEKASLVNCHINFDLPHVAASYKFVEQVESHKDLD